MATYANLSQPDKQVVQAFMEDLRAQSAKIYKHAIEAGVLLSAWNGGIGDIITSLDALEEIPNRTHRDGAQDVTRENVINNLMAYVGAVAALGSTGHRDNIVPAAGARNVRS